MRKSIIVALLAISLVQIVVAQKNTTEYFKDEYCSRKTNEHKAKFIRITSTDEDGVICKTVKKSDSSIPYSKSCTKDNQPIGTWIEKDGSVINYDFEVLYGEIKDDLIIYDEIKNETKTPVDGEFVGPKFKTSNRDFRMYIAENVKYPEYARDNDIQGRIKFQFVVSAQGNVEKISIVDGSNKYLDKDVVLVMKNCPQWTPATLNGNPVSVIMNGSCRFLISR